MKERSIFPRAAVALTLALIVLVSFACAGAQTKGAAANSTVTVTPAEGAKGSGIAITGAGFQKGEEIDIVLILGPGERVGLGTRAVDVIVADNDGGFSAESNIPRFAVPGIYNIEVEGSTGTLAKTKFQVK